MSYTRDRDAASRGVGAIASVDHALPAARWRRQQIGRALQRRDRAMSAIAQGALGSLHRVETPTPSKPPTSATFTNPDGSKTIINDHRTNPQPIVAPAAPYKPLIDPTRVPAKDESGALIYMKPKAPPSRSRLPPPPTAPGGAPPPPAAVLPPIAPAPVTPGAGTVGAGGGSLPTTPISQLPTPGLDPMQPLPDPGLTAPADDGTTKMLLIAGGAALLAFLIFRNHEGQTS